MRYGTRKTPLLVQRLEVHRRIARTDAVDERRKLVCERLVGDLEPVLGVSLAPLRKVEAADEDDVVSDRDLGMHVVVHGAGRVRRRVLAGERRAYERRTQQRLLPG